MDEIIKYSHNDYWCQSPIYDALEHGIYMFEADVVLFRGVVALAHSWRPWRSAYYGSLEHMYLKELHHMTDRKYYLYIELKSGRKKLGKKLHQLFLKYHNCRNITFVISANDKSLFSKIFHRREKLLKWLFDHHKYKYVLLNKKKMKTESINVWKKEGRK